MLEERGLGWKKRGRGGGVRWRVSDDDHLKAGALEQ